MRKLFLILTIFNFQSSIFNVMAQAPQAIPYQAAARDNLGNLIANQVVSLQFTIYDASATGTIVYLENQTATTNSLGLFTVNVGQGTVVYGIFENIAWGDGSKFIQVEMDISGGNDFIDMGTQQMFSVPFALHAANGNWSKTGSNISNSNSGNVSIGTATPAASALLEVSSTNKGFLPPRMTESQRNAISDPVMGLVVYCIDCGSNGGELQVHNGTSWRNMVGGVADVPRVAICNQIWRTKNLDVNFYRNGDPIPKVTDNTTWANLTTGAYCYYNNDSTTYAAIYGKLYNWYAVSDPRGLVPDGWHIPSDTEWAIMETCLGGFSVAGGKMKEAGTTHWTIPNAGANNSSGFTGLPGGTRDDGGSFVYIGNIGGWWSTTEYNPTLARNILLYYNGSGSDRGANRKQNGLSVRCLKD